MNADLRSGAISKCTASGNADVYALGKHLLVRGEIRVPAAAINISLLVNSGYENITIGDGSP